MDSHHFSQPHLYCYYEQCTEDQDSIASIRSNQLVESFICQIFIYQIHLSNSSIKYSSIKYSSIKCIYQFIYQIYQFIYQINSSIKSIVHLSNINVVMMFCNLYQILVYCNFRFYSFRGSVLPNTPKVYVICVYIDRKKINKLLGISSPAPAARLILLWNVLVKICENSITSENS